jgi:hypothetical protein
LLVSERLVLALRDGYPVSRGHSPARRDSLDHSGEGRLLERQGRMTAPPGDRGQLDFLRHVQRIFDEGEFVATYKFALLIAYEQSAARASRCFRALPSTCSK